MVSNTVNNAEYTSLNLSENNDPRFNFHTGWVFARYGNKGVSLADLEEAVYDGVAEAFTRLKPGKEDSFCGYAYRFVKKELCQRFKRLKNNPMSFTDLIDDPNDNRHPITISVIWNGVQSPIIVIMGRHTNGKTRRIREQSGNGSRSRCLTWRPAKRWPNTKVSMTPHKRQAYPISPSPNK